MKEYKKPNVQVIDVKSLDCFTDGVGVVTPGDSGDPQYGGGSTPAKGNDGWDIEEDDW